MLAWNEETLSFKAGHLAPDIVFREMNLLLCTGNLDVGSRGGCRRGIAPVPRNARLATHSAQIQLSPFIMIAGNEWTTPRQTAHLKVNETIK